LRYNNKPTRTSKARRTLSQKHVITSHGYGCRASCGIGERYLWIDRICIVQDDEAAKQQQLSSMGETYAGAFFTLVAAQNEEASLGLYGRRRMTIGLTESSAEKSAERSPRSHLSGKQIMLTHAMSLMQTKWYSRGWTFQEYVFSRRRVIFITTQ
jgi:hypothetical protein